MQALSGRQQRALVNWSGCWPTAADRGGLLDGTNKPRPRTPTSCSDKPVSQTGSQPSAADPSNPPSKCQTAQKPTRSTMLPAAYLRTNGPSTGFRRRRRAPCRRCLRKLSHARRRTPFPSGDSIRSERKSTTSLDLSDYTGQPPPKRRSQPRTAYIGLLLDDANPRTTSRHALPSYVANSSKENHPHRPPGARPRRAGRPPGGTAPPPAARPSPVRRQLTHSRRSAPPDPYRANRAYALVTVSPAKIESQAAMSSG